MPARLARWAARETPLSHRDFRLLFAGQSVSYFGDALVPVALAFAVLQTTGSATDLGVVLAAQYLPLGLFLLVGGVFADRLPRQMVMLGADGVRSVVQIGTATLLWTGSASLPALVALQAAYGFATAFFNPASTGLIPDVVCEGEIAQANALVSSTRSMCSIVGPAVAGVVVAAASPSWAFALDGATFIVSGATLAALSLPRQRTRSATTRIFTELASGWNEFASHRWLWLSVCYFSLYFAGVLGPLLVLGPAVADQSYGGAKGWAAVMVAAGVGNIFGALVAGHVRPRYPLRTAYALSLVVPLQLLFLGIRASLILVILAAAAARIAMGFFGTVWYSTLQLRVPRDSLSRVSAYDWLGSVVFFPAGLALAGPAARALGTNTLLEAAAAFSAITTVLLLAQRSVRELASTMEEPPNASRPRQPADAPVARLAEEG